MKIELDEVIDALESASPDLDFFYNRETGEIIMRSDDMIMGMDDDEFEEQWDDLIRLPGQYEIDEYSMMDEFVAGLPEGKAQDELDQSLLGKGAFRRFKDKANRLGLADSWYEYRNNQYLKIAIEWCEANEIEYIVKKEGSTNG
ncbi:MAG: UPF0158 family protein [Erysipelotrichaceae bacterium]|nr:UPF0158 family protein [Erysipelotrichaceae bacterium]MDD3810216.1 UPF0158 family protein [Erysipelotrichaceae bacterium]